MASLVGNFFIGIIVYKTQALRKPINYFIVSMAMSDLFYPLFVCPRRLTQLYADSWVISGLLAGQTIAFLAIVSLLVSIQSLILIAFVAVVFPLRSPIISLKQCPLFILATWIIAMAVLSPHLFALKVAEYLGKVACQWRWKETFGEP